MPDTPTACDNMRWLLLDAAAVPERWRDRAIPMALVPLLPHELDGEETGEGPAGGEAQLLSFLAQGLPKKRIAAELHISLRTLDRRLSVLRDRLGVRTLAELAAAAARRGFGAGARE